MIQYKNKKTGKFISRTEYEFHKNRLKFYNTKYLCKILRLIIPDIFLMIFLILLMPFSFMYLSIRNGIFTGISWPCIAIWQLMDDFDSVRFFKARVGLKKYFKKNFNNLTKRANAR